MATNQAFLVSPGSGASWVNLPTMVRTGQAWYYVPTGTLTTQIPVKNQMESLPIWLPAGITIDRIGAEVTLGQASTNLALGIYSDSTFGYPGALLVDGGTVASTSSGNKEVTVATNITVPGLYWLACVTQGGTTQPTMRAFNTNYGAVGMICTFTTQPGVTNVICPYAVTGVSGALPDPFGTPPLTNANQSQVRIYIRVT